MTTEIKLGSAQYINFGKYKGKTIPELFNNKNSCAYLTWCVHKDILNAETKGYVCNCFSKCSGTKGSKHLLIVDDNGDYSCSCAHCEKEIFKVPYETCTWCNKPSRKSNIEKYGSCWKCKGSLEAMRK